MYSLSVLDLQALGKCCTYTVLSVYHEHLFRLFFKSLDPVDQTFLIRMTAQSRHFPDLSAHGNRLTEQLHLVSTLYQCPAQCSHRLIADEQDRTLRRRARVS